MRPKHQNDWMSSGQTQKKNLNDLKSIVYIGIQELESSGETTKS
jgi:hypothetical protein